MNEVEALASHLRRKYGDANERVTFTHVPTGLDAAEIVSRLRSTSLAALMPPEGTALTHPERPWYFPIQRVAVSEDALAGVGITASTWGPPHFDFSAGELALRILYAAGEAKAQVELRLRETETKVPSLSRSFYDHQRAETGYEGEDHVSEVPTSDQVRDFLALIKEATTAG